MAVKKVVKIETQLKSKGLIKKVTLKKEKIVEPVKVVIADKVEPVISAKTEPKAVENKSRSSIDRGSLLLGATLLFIGVVWILGQIFNVSLGGYLWPLVIILPGVLIFISALNTHSAGGDALAVVGSILTSVGLLLFVQQLTHTWASWAYGWALIAPTSIGIGQVIYGKIKKHESLVNTGLQMTKVGLWIFSIGFLFFELIIGLNGFGISRLGLPVFPVVLIGIGALILIRAITYKR